MAAPWPRATNKSTALVRLMQQSLPDVIVRDDYVQWFFDEALLEAIRREPLSSGFTPTNDYERFTQISYRYIDLRERYFDTIIQESVAGGSRQVVSLGAGFDTRCLRLPELKSGSVRLFETDRPDTILEKAAVLKSRLGRLPAGLTLIPLDLNSEGLESIRAHGFDPLLPTTFVMQGLLFYLPKETVSSVLGAIRRDMSDGSLLAFDSCSTLMVRPNDEIPGISVGIRRLAEMGEPLLFAMDAPEMERWLGSMRFGSIRVVQQDELEARLVGTKTIPGNMWYVVSARP